MGAVKGFVGVVAELPSALAMALHAWPGWIVCIVAWAFMVWTLKMAWSGHFRRFAIWSGSALLLGFTGYLSAFLMRASYEAMAVILLSAFIVVIAIATMVIGTPILVVKGRSAGQIESEF